VQPGDVVIAAGPHVPLGARRLADHRRLQAP
jgi:hypothetical protein